MSPLVAAPKPNNADAVRLRVDMRYVNTAVPRERHVMPTVDDIISDHNGATTFSKLDLNQGYHQLELTSESRDETTFSTQDSVWRHKILKFGVSSASDISQLAIARALSGIDGVKNMSGDIIVYGKTKAEHDRNLRNVFIRLRESNITLNRIKCEFNCTELKFYGFIFSDKGITADTAKVASIIQLEKPTNVSEMKSLKTRSGYGRNNTMKHSMKSRKSCNTTIACLFRSEKEYNSHFLPFLHTFGTKQRLTVATNIHVTVDGCLISPDATTKNLGIVYDSTLSMERQVNAVCRGAYLRLHNISRIRRFITQDATKTLIQAFVISKLDCGNALLAGVSCNLLRKLQRVQNMAAMVITFTPRREHISPVLRSLHWLPINRRIAFKILLLVYLCLNDVAPQYLAEMLTTHAATRSLRSSDKQLLVVPRSKRHGDRSFNVVAPVLWNSLPESMKSSSSVASFKRTLKTFLFCQEYGVIN